MITMQAFFVAIRQLENEDMKYNPKKLCICFHTYNPQSIKMHSNIYKKSHYFFIPPCPRRSFKEVWESRPVVWPHL